MFGLQPYERGKNDLFNYFDDMERNFFGGFPHLNGTTGFRTDIKEEKEHYLLEAELPGFDKKDIHVDLNGDTLTIHAEHSNEKEEKKDGYVRKERHFGSYSRSFDVSGIDVNKISGSYKNGILELMLPKCGGKEIASKSIDIQ